MSDKKKDSKAIWLIMVSLISLIGVIVALNSASLFKQEQQEERATRVNIGDKANQAYTITVYYFPPKKAAAKALTFFFKEHGYNVDMQLATTVDALKGSEKSPSHIFFNRSEMERAMKIKKLIEEVIGYPVNAYRFHEEQTDPSMMMVFTEYEA